MPESDALPLVSDCTPTRGQSTSAARLSLDCTTAIRDVPVLMRDETIHGLGRLQTRDSRYLPVSHVIGIENREVYSHVTPDVSLELRSLRLTARALATRVAGEKRCDPAKILCFSEFCLLIVVWCGHSIDRRR